MDNQETLATLGTKDTGRKQTKQKYKTKNKKKDEQHVPTNATGSKPRCS